MKVHNINPVCLIQAHPQLPCDKPYPSSLPQRKHQQHSNHEADLAKNLPSKTAISFKGASLSELTMHMQQHYCQCRKGSGRHGTTAA